MRNQFKRRQFLKSSALYAGISILPGYRSFGKASPNERLKIAHIGIGNYGSRDIMSAARTGECEVVALCDVDMQGKHTHAARYEYGQTTKPPAKYKGKGPKKNKARFFSDFREMFDQMGDELDAVFVTTPPHSHFSPTILAMSMGIPVYVQKPLAHTFGQCERLIKMAQKTGVVTQIGNQGFSGANYFQFKAYLEAGVIKNVRRISAAWTKSRTQHKIKGPYKEFPSETLPEGINWDAWLDYAPETPYSKMLHPLNWRAWFRFGGGAISDLGPHIMDSAHHFLKLGLPSQINMTTHEGRLPLAYPLAATTQFKFPARGDMPACEMNWYDGPKNVPELEAEYVDPGKDPKMGAGKIIYTDDLVFKGGTHSSPLRIVPQKKFLEMRESLPQFQQKTGSHHQNFINAIKGKEKARSSIAEVGELYQVICLGSLAQQIGGSLNFDAKTKQFTNNPAANALLDPAPRKGWEQFYNL